MNKILILFAHPKYERSTTNSVMVDQVKDLAGVTFVDLYECYPDFDIDVPREQRLLLEHDIVIWHHPLYWYSCPPLMKQWIDMVLEFDWAYGPKGHALAGKKVLQVITTGASREVYCSEGRNLYSINEFLRPFEQTARLCHMQYMAPYAVMGTHRLNRDQVTLYADQYRQIIECLHSGADIEQVKGCVFERDLPLSQVSD